MSITITGRVERQELGTGTWALISSDGQTYELKDPPEELCQSQTQVKVEGDIREDVMSLAMIGPILEVKSFQRLD